MSGKGKKKMGYKQYAGLLYEAHKNLEILAQRYQELQTYFIAYVEYKGDNIQFNDWMNTRIKAMASEVQEEKEKKEHADEEV